MEETKKKKLGKVRCALARRGEALLGRAGQGILNIKHEVMMIEKTEYIPPDETYPMWERAVEMIRDRFESESYGLIVTHEELKECMGIKPATKISEVQKEQLDYLVITKVKEALLEDYNLCLYSVIGVGYEVLNPYEQIRKGADYYTKKSQQALMRTMSALVNVDIEALDAESRELQVLKMSRIAFIKTAFRKRKIPIPKMPTQIEEV